MANDVQEMVLDEGTVAEMADLWMDANADRFDEAGIDMEGGWEGEPPAELDAIAEDAARDIVDQLRNPEDDSAGIVVLNEIGDLVDTIYFRFAQNAAASPEDFDAWYEALDDEEPDDEGEPGDE
jgi:hypothetical protein